MLEIDRFIEALLKRPCCRMIDTEKFISVKPIFQLLHIDTECLSYNNSKRTINFDQMRLYSSKIYCQSLISNRDQYFKRVWEFSRSLLHITAYSTANRNWSEVKLKWPILANFGRSFANFVHILVILGQF